MFHVLSVAALSVVTLATSGEDRKPVAEPFDDAKFVAAAASGGMHEVELGKLAATRARREDVKKFGQKMVDDHAKANELLKKAAKEAGLMMPDKMNDINQQQVERFKDLKGDDFDREYLQHMLESHEKAVADFARAGKEAKNPQVKDFAAKTLPTLQEHLETVKKLMKQ